MNTADLYSVAKEFQSNPKSMDLCGRFLDRLNQETSVDEISNILSLDYERIAVHALLRIVELLKEEDIDLLLCIALWYYNHGMDQEAYKFMRRAKEAKPLCLPVLQTEIYLNYEHGADFVLAVCKDALIHHPDDRWLNEVKETIEQTGKLDRLDGPPLKSRWQSALIGRYKS